MLDIKKIIAGSLILFAATFILLSAAKPAFAQDGTPYPTDDEVNAIARKLYCPVCENIPLDVCATQACAQWRDLIRQKLSQGWTQEQIIAYFADQYGDRVLATPPVRDGMSLNILAYVIPPLAFLAGIVVVVHYMSRKKTSAIPEVLPDTASIPQEDEDAYLKRFDEEIRRNP